MPSPSQHRIRRLAPYLVVAALIVTAIVAVLIWRPTGNTQLVIGGVLPLTGDAAAFGRNASRGVELAIEQAEARGIIKPGHVRFVAEDSKGQPSQAVAAARKLLDVDRADAIVGDVTSAGTQAIIPIITESETPTISPSASDPALRGASPFFARVWPSDNYEAAVIAAYARDRGYKRIAILSARTDYGVAMVAEFKETITPDAIVAEVLIDRESLNLRPAIQRLLAAEPDAIFGIMYPEDWMRFLQQIRETQTKIPILATATFEDSSLLREPNAEGVVFASPRALEDLGARAEFMQAYRAKFSEEPGVLADTGFDAAMILISGFTRQSDAPVPKDIMTYIHRLRDYDGASGTMSFDESGDVKKPYGLRTVANSSFIWMP